MSFSERRKAEEPCVRFTTLLALARDFHHSVTVLMPNDGGLVLAVLPKTGAISREAKPRPGWSRPCLAHKPVLGRLQRGSLCRCRSRRCPRSWGCLLGSQTFQFGHHFGGSVKLAGLCLELQELLKLLFIGGFDRGDRPRDGGFVRGLQFVQLVISMGKACTQNCDSNDKDSCSRGHKKEARRWLRLR